MNGSRGYAAIGLFAPIDEKNIGSALRAASCYGAALVAYTGQPYKRACTDTTAYYRHAPLVATEDLRSVIPFDCVPVAVDLVEGAESLVNYRHPLSAFYVFGPENGTLGESVLSWCRDRVMVPTRFCMNLAATVNVVLYDRLAKDAHEVAK